MRRRQAISILIEQRDAYTVLSANDGVFVRDATREMMAQIRKLQDDGQTRFLLDLSTCAYISSEGLGMVSELWKFCMGKPAGRLIVLLSSDPHNEVSNLFETVGLLAIMHGSLFINRRAAEAAFSPS